jgi:hypothetical protein
MTAGVSLWCLAAPAQAQPQPEVDWSVALKSDAQALHDVYLRDHPGTVDEENPAFRSWLWTGLRTAISRTPGANSYSAYWWALREYVAGFNDGHVFLEQKSGAPALPLRWPGFLTREVAGKNVVFTRLESPATPASGAELLSCDGVGAADLAAKLVGRFRGRWNLASQHDLHSWRLFLDAANPYVRLPARCVFRQNGVERSFDLQWSSLTQQELDQRVKSISGGGTRIPEVRAFGSQGLWISLPTFTSDTSSPSYRSLEGVVDRLRSNAAVTASKIIVLDVRGNGGGSSAWGDQLAAALWGERNAEAAKPRSHAVDWRASPANAQAIEAFGAQSSGRARAWAGHIAGGIKNAVSSGRLLWRETSLLGGFLGSLLGGRSSGGSIDHKTFRTRARIYILTDGGCASACLDAMDVWTRLGAVPVGRETSADSLYMEIRRQDLPAGLSIVSVPMKVYRGRSRGTNQAYRPVHVFEGDMNDRAALERWIARLPEAE